MVETMRYADPGDCEEMAQAQEAFFTELSKYLSLSRSLSDRAANNGQQVAGHDDRPNIF